MNNYGDTNRGTKGNLFSIRISSPLISLSPQLGHRDGTENITSRDICFFQTVPLSPPKLQTKLQLSVCMWRNYC